MRAATRGERALAVVAVVLALALGGAAPSAGGGTSAGARERRTTTVPLVAAGRPVAFSPNGDHRQDRARIRFRLARPARVTVTLRNRRGDVLLRVPLGRLPAGRNGWTWDGRRRNGAVVPDKDYEVTLRATTGTRTGTATTYALVDTVRPRGRLVTTRPTVHPLATVVDDHVQLVWLLDSWSPWGRDFWPEEELARSTLQIRTWAGDRVWRSTSTDDYTPVFDWYGRRGGAALPAGRYVARVEVTDAAGNRRRSGTRLRVSHAQLVEEVRTVTTVAARTERYEPYDGGCNGCLDYCSPVPSERFPDGLSFRPCDGPFTQGWPTLAPFATNVPFAVAPVDSYRVTATGGPTTPGSGGVGQVDGTTIGPGDASATTPWVAVDLTNEPFLPDRSVPVAWTFHTDQPNSYDVATFTVDYRHYVPAG